MVSADLESVIHALNLTSPARLSGFRDSESIHYASLPLVVPLLQSRAAPASPDYPTPVSLDVLEGN